MEALAPLVPTQSNAASFSSSSSNSVGSSNTLRIEALERENANLARTLMALRAELASQQSGDANKTRDAQVVRDAEIAAALATVREIESSFLILKGQVRVAIDDTRARMNALEANGVPVVQELSARLAEARQRLADKEAEYAELKSLVLGDRSSHDTFQLGEVLRLRTELAKKEEELRVARAISSPLSTPAISGERPAVTYKHGMRFSDDAKLNMNRVPQGTACGDDDLRDTFYSSIH